MLGTRVWYRHTSVLLIDVTWWSKRRHTVQDQLSSQTTVTSPHLTLPLRDTPSGGGQNVQLRYLIPPTSHPGPVFSQTRVEEKTSVLPKARHPLSTRTAAVYKRLNAIYFHMVNSPRCRAPYSRPLPNPSPSFSVDSFNTSIHRVLHPHQGCRKTTTLTTLAPA